jgi:hypothetical protein
MDKPDTAAPPGPVGPERSEGREVPTPVGEAEGKTERIASMRHELLVLQRSLLEAQQRITSELAGRAEDADRFEALEGRLRDHEVKTTEASSQLAMMTAAYEKLRGEVEQRDARLEESSKKTRELTELVDQHAASVRDAKEQLAAREVELTAAAVEREVKTRLEGELDAARGKHRELTEQAERHESALRDTKALLAERDTDLTARTSERDALQATTTRLEGELEELRRTLDSGRGRAQELAKQLTSFGQDLLDAIVAQPGRSAGPQRSATRPPPIPTSRPRAEANEAIVVDDRELARSVVEDRPAVVAAPAVAPVTTKTPRKTGWALITGLALGAAVTVVIMQQRGTNTPSPAKDPKEGVVEAPRPAEVVEPGVVAIADAGAFGDDRSSGATPGDAGALPAQGAEPLADAQGTGTIKLPVEADGHRVFVDGHKVEVKNLRVVVPCGKHEVQIGTQGELKTLDVACTGETELR